MNCTTIPVPFGKPSHGFLSNTQWTALIKVTRTRIRTEINLIKTFKFKFKSKWTHIPFLIYKKLKTFKNFISNFLQKILFYNGRRMTEPVKSADFIFIGFVRNQMLSFQTSLIHCLCSWFCDIWRLTCRQSNSSITASTIKYRSKNFVVKNLNDFHFKRIFFFTFSFFTPRIH